MTLYNPLSGLSPALIVVSIVIDWKVSSYWRTGDVCCIHVSALTNKYSLPRQVGKTSLIVGDYRGLISERDDNL